MNEKNGRCKKKSESLLSNGLTGGSHELTGPRYVYCLERDRIQNSVAYDNLREGKLR
jgi:hypothetical protein